MIILVLEETGFIYYLVVERTSEGIKFALCVYGAIYIRFPFLPVV
jgi:hypothetical protein